MPPHLFQVDSCEAGQTVAGFLRARLGLSHNEALRLLRERRVRVGDAACRDPARPLRPGDRVRVTPEERPAPPVPPPPRAARGREAAVDVRFADEHVVVVEKPPGLTTMRHADEAAEHGPRGRHFLPPTLADLLPGLLPSARGRPSEVRAVHRLDKETSGLVVFARSPAAEGHLGRQFRAHSTERQYLALVRGAAPEGRVESWLVEDRGDGRRGSGPAGQGQRAVTHVRVAERLGGFGLVECRLETGRTHQVRIHLGEAGAPLCGERVYDRPVHGRPYPDGSGAGRVMLHAAQLGFDHPATGGRLRFTSPLPADMAGLLRRLRRAGG